MRAIRLPAIGRFDLLEDAPVPVPGPGEALIRVAVAGFCRTDLKLVDAGHRDLVLPRIPGEEAVGTVEALGPGAPGPAPGTRVYVYPGDWCGACPACAAGAENLCRSMRIVGFHRDGGFAEWLTAPAKSLLPLPAGLDEETAVFAEPLSCCLNALELARLRRGEKIGLWGAGPAGTLAGRAALALGAEPFWTDPDPRRAARVADRLLPDGLRVDVALVAVGDAGAYAAALERLAPRGRLVLFSGLPKGSASPSVPFDRLHYEEQSLVGAYGCALRHGAAALEHLASGAVPVADLVTHRLRLDEFGLALDLVRNRTGLKVLLRP